MPDPWNTTGTGSTGVYYVPILLSWPTPPPEEIGTEPVPSNLLNWRSSHPPFLFARQAPRVVGRERGGWRRRERRRVRG